MLEELINIRDAITTEEIRKFSGESRKTYRVLIMKIFCAAWTNNTAMFSQGIIELFIMLELRERDHTKLDEEEYTNKRNRWCSYLNIYNFKCVQNNEESKIYSLNDDALNKGVKFCKNYLDEFIKTDQKMYMYSQIKDFWDLENVYKKSKTVKMNGFLSCFWIDLRPFEAPIPTYTFPDYLAYQDMINLWNDAVYKRDKLITLKGDEVERRRISHSFVSTGKYAIVAGVHFVETYLFYFYYFCRLEKKFPRNKLTNRKNIRSVNDKEIIEQLLFKEYKDISQNLKELYEAYKQALEIRDAIVHLSPFKDDNSNKTRIELTMGFELWDISKHLQVCYDLVVAINETIDFNLLFWSELMEVPNFRGQKIISNLNILK